MTSDVICASPLDSILKVAALMTEHQVSSVVIVQGTENASSSPIPLGLITERDLVQFQALSLIPESIVAETVMSTPLFTIHLEDTLWNVHQLMLQRFISRLVVVGEQGELLGIVTQTSLLKVLDPKELYALTEVLETRVSQLESEKIALLEARTLELEQQVEQAVAYQQMQTQLAEQQRTEADLRRSEQFYAALANATPVGIFRTDALGQYTYVNERWCEITGLNPLVTPQLSWFDGLDPSDRKKISKGWTILTDPNRVLTVECRYQKTGRLPTWVLGQVAAERNALGDIVGFVGTIFDISDRKLTEKQLRQALDTNQAVLSAIPDLILRVSRDGIYRSIVPKNDVTLLAPIDQHLGKHLVEVLPLELAQERVAMIEEAFRTGRTQNQEYSLWIQGELHYEEARCVVCGSDEVLFLVRDITATKRNKLALQESEARLRMAVSAANQGIYDLDILTGEEIVTPEYALMLGYDPKTFRESLDRWAERLHPEDHGKVTETFRQYLAGEIPVYRTEFRQRTNSGDWLWILSSGRIVERDENGNPLRMLGSHTDINRLKQAELSLQARARQQSAIAQLGQEALAATDLSLLMDRITSIVAENLAVEYSKILEILPENEGLLLCSGVGWQHGLVGEVILAIDADSQTTYILTNQEPVIVEDLQTELRFQGSSLLREHQVVSGISVIVHGGDRPFGVLGAYTTQRRNFTQEDVNFLKGIANILATAIGRKRIEVSLRNSEAELLAVFRAMTDLVVIRDIQGRCLKVAPTNTLGFYIPPTEMIGKTTYETFPTTMAKVLHDAIQTCIANKRTVETEFSYEKSGRTFFFSTTVSPMTETTALIVSKDISDRKVAEAALIGSQKQFRNLVENSPDIIERFDLNLKHLYVSPSLAALNGMPTENFLGKSCSDLGMDEIMVNAWESAAARLLSSGQKQVIEFNTPTLEGLRTFEMAIVPEFSADQSIESILCISRDITERKIAEEALQESETRFRQLAENIQDVFWIADRELTEILYVSPTYEILWGRSCPSLYERPESYLESVHPEDRDRVLDLIQRQRYVGWNHEYRILQSDGTLRWIWEQTFPVPDPGGIINRIVGISQDITERKESESQLLYNSLHDSLTQLPNRSQLIQRIELALLRVQRAEIHTFAILFMDLDRFKNINDSLGHLAGDQLLVKIAQRLQSKIRAVDLVARLGGDEFVILLEDLPGVQNAIQVAEKILNEFQIPIVLKQREIIITTSIGIVFGTSDYTQASELLRDADTAMYQAKSQGKNNYKVFNTLMHVEVRERLDLESDLRKGLEREEFIIYYQPILDLSTLNWVGFEALIRWNHPTLGFISPASFLPLAEETGLIVSLDYWTLKTACQQLSQWQRQFPSAEALKISVNLTDQGLGQNNFIEYVDMVLSQTSLESRSLNLEITEGVLVKDISKTIEVLTNLQAREIQISIDDFGTGYSSLNYLHRLPLDTLKIDRSFVSQMQTGSRNHKIVKTIITLSNELGIRVVAEGIETEQQLELLISLGCEMGQGYLFAKPMPVNAVELLLRARG
ncbi:MAG: EAL domain-containing protein [Thermosynechococcaceae cyanobacterium MS004]|nr:EAL domain-containing protein [Thermosynechococcaceae cyanobacterium MS004]